MANLNIEQKTVKRLFQEMDLTFLIPDYQRPYAWGESECKTLWDDLFYFAFPNGNLDPFDKSERYFLGPIVTFKNGDYIEVIDGQQRLTTLMLLLRAYYNRVQKGKDVQSEAMKTDIAKCIWKANEFGITENCDLKLDSQVATDNDKEELLDILKDGIGGKRKSQYAKNFKFFEDQVNELLNTFPTYFVHFPARILNYCVLLPIEAESQTTALRIFSTLNDRGKPLADADIFKAQLYKHYASAGQKGYMINTWKQLEEISNDALRSIYSTPLDELFTRYMYYQRAKAGNKKTTVEGLRKFYEGNGSYPLLHDNTTLNNLLSLAQFWQDVERQNPDRFTEATLRRLFVLNYAPNSIWRYLVSVYFMHNKLNGREIEEQPFCQLLDRLTAFIWAYTLTNPTHNSLRTPIFDEMVNIVNDREVTFANYKISEERYRDIVGASNFSNNRPITRSMLVWWAYERPDQTLLPLDTGLDTEHIYPRGRQENEHGLANADNLDKLGNKSLLEKTINKKASDYRFADKAKIYKGFTTESGHERKGTHIAELLELAATHTDFTESDILERDKRIVDAFVSCLDRNNILLRSEA